MSIPSLRTSNKIKVTPNALYFVHFTGFIPCCKNKFFTISKVERS